MQTTTTQFAQFTDRPRIPSSLRPLATKVHEVPSRPARASGSEVAAQEAQLVSLLLERDPAAWRRFSDQYAGLVISCIRRVLGRFSRVTCEQDIDEVYARFCCELLAHDHKKLRAYDPAKGTRLSTWLGMLASNATYDYLRRIKRDRVCEPLPETDTLRTEDSSPFEQVAQKEQALIAHAVLGELSERDQTFVQLYFGEGLEVEAVAARMGISEKTVYTKKHKITARLEKLLGKDTAA